jgi:hypothetical protein
MGQDTGLRPQQLPVLSIKSDQNLVRQLSPQPWAGEPGAADLAVLKRYAYLRAVTRLEPRTADRTHGLRA